MMKRLLPLSLALLAAPASAQHDSQSVLDVIAKNRLGGYSRPDTTVLRVDDAGGILANGILGIGSIPIEGEGSRMMWYPAKGAFRAGGVYGAEEKSRWNDGNIGYYSTALGGNTLASGIGSFAAGSLSQATGIYSVALGYEGVASGRSSVALGEGTLASGIYSVAMGYEGVASARGALAMGYRSRASANYAVALGWSATADADYAVAVGSAADTDGYSGALVFADGSTSLALKATAEDQFSVRAAGGARLFTDKTLSAGVYLDAGGSSWNVVSDSTRKADVAALDGEALLGQIAQLPVTTWRYKAEADRGGQAIRHVGPMAQDWQRLVAGPLGLNTESTVINQGDLDGVTLAAAKALEARTAAQADEIASLRAALALQTEEVAALREQNAALAEQAATVQAVAADLAALRAALAASTAPVQTAALQTND